MHNPNTLAFRICRPWPTRSKSFGWYWPDWVHVWHVDPQRDGTADSCGWSSPHLTEKDRAIVENLMRWEADFPFIFSQLQRIENPRYEYFSVGPGDAAMIILELWAQIAWAAERRRLTARDTMAALRLSHNQFDNFRAALAASDPDEQRRTLSFIVRAYRKHRRPWWRHPRWHVHHWRIRVLPLMHLKRSLFTRCAGCGQRIGYGSIVYANAHSSGPRWFRSEPHVFHLQCAPHVRPTRTPE